jgi:very-short-patch-repair endonuclease
MNEIEQKFYDAWQRRSIKEKVSDPIVPQARFHGYILDFMVPYGNEADSVPQPICIEIDGQEYHKTKAQRLSDYQRDRYLQMCGFRVVRFPASEVFVDADSRVEEVHRIRFKMIRTEMELQEKWHRIDEEVRSWGISNPPNKG